MIKARSVCSVVFLLVFVLLYNACSSSTEKEQPDRVRVRLAAEPKGLNFFFSFSGYAEQVRSYIFMSLQTYDPRDLQLKPLLIKQAPEIAKIESGEYKGGVAYTFEIREEAEWGDGRPVLASDYLFTHKIVWNPATGVPHRHMLKFVQDIIVDENNPRKFTIFTHPTYFLAEELLSTIPIFPEHIYDEKGLMKNVLFKTLRNLEETTDENLKQFAEEFKDSKFSHEPVGVIGCGAYQLQQWNTGQSIILQKKDKWWGSGLESENDLLMANPKTIEFKIIPDNVAAIAALKDGGLDVMSEVEPASFSEMLQNDFVKDRFELSAPPHLSYSYLGLNSKQPPLDDQKVRRALAHLLDIDNAIESVLYNLGERVLSPIHPSKSTYHRGLQPVAYDTEEGKRLLSETGWSDSNSDGVLDKTIDGKLTDLRFKVTYSASNNVAANMIRLFKEDAIKAGVVLESQPLEFNTLVKEYRARDYDIVFSRWSQMPGADDFRQLWHTDSDTPMGANRTGFGDAASDAIIDSIAVTLDEETRNQLYLSIQEQIYEAQTYIFLYAPLERIAISNDFKAKTSVLRPGFFVNRFERK